ncbi:protein-glutamate O-methyltransferase CheR [Phragmitibacter flavus]|uniref:Protein-glutamate O-methyltransferase CheR n=1 Tax=Phragmitibacter flavus TaxID=2576071 RepID=A0A5R8K956_9BACT|nr:CheR family methyltransferase [Phragmitibacter flavus]TLD68820.1 protein-glutamate O-methyltransferase CheR [Phragmitibacter flavus]
MVERVLEDGGFGALKHYVIEVTGLEYYVDREKDLAAAVVRALDGGEWKSAVSYLAGLRQPGGMAMDRLAEELTIGETFFFRHTEMFTALREHVFPEVHARKEKERSIRIWSAGCSVGAEPYSLSILLRSELAHLFLGWRIEIVGTDINRRFLKMAREGVFEPWALRGLSEEVKGRSFEKRGKRWGLQKRFMEGVRFQQHNLVRDAFPSLGNELFGFDLIICRNVMIYFGRENVQRLADQFHQTLLPGGWLAVGHAEPHQEIFKEFETVMTPGATLYHRRSAGGRVRKSAVALCEAWKPVVLPKREVEKVEVLPVQEMLLLPPLPRREVEVKGGMEEWTELRVLADAGRFAEASEACKRLLALRHFDSPGLYFMHALLLQQSGKVGEAHEALKRTLYLDRELALVHYHLGLVLQKLERGAEAKRAWRNALLLVEGLAEDEAIRYGDGLTAGDLRCLIDQQAGRVI